MEISEMATELKSWEEMSTLEQYACTYWDMYKDAHGIRPRFVDMSSWTEADFEKEFANLDEVIEQNNIHEQKAQQHAISKFEAIVDITIASGAADRQTALRWIFDTEELDSTSRFDQEYYEFSHGLPYGYICK
jgi:putative alpha-1,2-mannosidase